MNAVDDIVLCAMNHPSAMAELKFAASLPPAGASFAVQGFAHAASIAAARGVAATTILQAAVKLAKTCDAAWLAENTEGA